MEDDLYGLKKVARRYRVQLNSWGLADPEVAEAIEKILEMNKEIVLRSTKESSIQKVDIELTSFIDQFLDRISPTEDNQNRDDRDYMEHEDNKLRLPKSMIKEDLDYDFQLKKYYFLQNLLSNELKLVENLRDSKNQQTKENDQWRTYAREFQAAYLQELEKATKEGIEEKNTELFNALDQGTLLDMNLNNELDDDFDIEELEVLNELESHLAKLRTQTEHLSEVSFKLDEINTLLDDRI